MVIEVDQLEDNLYVLRGQGGGGNTAVFVTTDGVVVVDSKNPGWGPSILEAIGELTSNPVTTLINTHSHHDHVSGNVAFPANVDIVTHEVTKANMAVMRAYSGRTEPPANVFADSMGRGLPTMTFSDRMSLGRGADQVDLYHFGRGHTGGDAWIVFPALRTLHSGDIFPGKNLPFLDANNGGSGVDIANSLQKAHDTIRDVDTIITGHSTQMTWADLHEYAAFNRNFLAAVRAGRAARPERGSDRRRVDDAGRVLRLSNAAGRPAQRRHFESSSTSSRGTARSNPRGVDVDAVATAAAPLLRAQRSTV